VSDTRPSQAKSRISGQWYAEIHAFEHKMETKGAKAYDRLEAALEKEFDRVRRARPLKRAKVRGKERSPSPPARGTAVARA
jgi:hypothetical protein